MTRGKDESIINERGKNTGKALPDNTRVMQCLKCNGFWLAR